jgi:hypothetical protein
MDIAASRVPAGGGRMHPLDRAAAVVVEAIEAVYRDIDALRSTVPDLVVAGAEERGAEAETRA